MFITQKNVKSQNAHKDTTSGKAFCSFELCETQHPNTSLKSSFIPLKLQTLGAILGA